MFETSVDLDKAEKDYKEMESDSFYVCAVYLNVNAADQGYIFQREIQWH